MLERHLMNEDDCKKCELEAIVQSAKDWIQDAYQTYGEEDHTCKAEQADTEE